MEVHPHSNQPSFAAMAGLKVKARLVADPSIGVGDLLQAMENFLDAAGDNNLQKLLQPPGSVGWKTSCHPQWLASLTLLWKELLKVAPNGVVPSKKNRTCLEKLQERRNVNTGRRTKEEFAERMDEHVRIGLAHLRTLRQSDVARLRCMRKADAKEQAALTEILDMLPQLEGGQPAEGDSTALVVVPAAPEVGEPSKAERRPIKLILDPVNVFEKVLKRPALDDESAPASSAKRKSVEVEAFQERPTEFEGFFQGMFSELTPSEESMLKGLRKQKPINHGYTSQLQRANKARKQMEREGEEQEEAEEEQDEEAASEEEKAPKKPKKNGKTKSFQEQEEAQQKSKTSESKDKIKPKGKAKGKPKAKPAKAEAMDGVQPAEVPKGFDANASRALNRKRFTSRAHHQAYDKAKHEGCDEDTRKDRGRAASAKASVEFVNLWPLQSRCRRNQVEAETADEEEKEAGEGEEIAEQPADVD